VEGLACGCRVIVVSFFPEVLELSFEVASSVEAMKGSCLFGDIKMFFAAFRALCYEILSCILAIGKVT